MPSTGSATNGDEYAMNDIIVAIRDVEDDATKPSWFDEVYNWVEASSTSFMLRNTKLSNTGKNLIS